MKKILSIFIVMIMILVTFVGCANESENPDKNPNSWIGSGGISISDEERLEIYELYKSWSLSYYGEDFPVQKEADFTYYGFYSGFHVLSYMGWFFSHTIEWIDDLDFSRTGTGEIFAISKEIGGELKDIYGQGYISRADLEEIHDLHMKMYPHAEDIIE